MSWSGSGVSYLRCATPAPKPQPRVPPPPVEVPPETVRKFEVFCGATIQLFQVEVLIVLVGQRLLGDPVEAPLVVAAFQAKFKRTIVLAAQDTRGVPTFFGPGPIAAVLARIPFGALAWKRYRFSKPAAQMLPIPVDPPAEDPQSYAASIASSDRISVRGSEPSPHVARRTLGLSEDGGATRR